QARKRDAEGAKDAGTSRAEASPSLPQNPRGDQLMAPLQGEHSAGAKGSVVAGEPPKKLTYAENIELDGIEQRIAEAEQEQARLEAVLADPDVYRERAAEVPALQQELAQASALTEQL